MRLRRSPDPLCGTILWREFGASAYDLGSFCVGLSYTSLVLELRKAEVQLLRIPLPRRWVNKP
jgi:hypothetical protein